MDNERFDRIARALAASPNRRVVSRAVAGLALGGALVAAESDLTEGKKKPCKPCRKRINGRCTGKKPDGRPCEGTGKCFNGKCLPKPDCLSAGADCTQGNPGVCCSGVCQVNDHCQAGGVGNFCLAQSDCAFGTCIAYLCRET